MREIKFRGKRLDNGEWVYGHYVKCNMSGNEYIVTELYETFTNHKLEQVDAFQLLDNTKGQYTGLKDEQNTDQEIFDQDIIEWLNFVNFMSPNFSSEPDDIKLIGIVEWDNEVGYWKVTYEEPYTKEKVSNWLYDVIGHGGKKIGDIHENKGDEHDKEAE